MGTYKEVDGDLIDLAEQGQFDIVAHGCNCFCTMGAGIAPQMARAFECDRFKLEALCYRGDINKLGQIDYGKAKLSVERSPVKAFLTVINCYTQFGPGYSHRVGATHPLSYPALIMCLQKINHRFKGQHIGLPQIGCGLAKGNWNDVKKLIQDYLTDLDVTVVIYKPKQDVSNNI